MGLGVAGATTVALIVGLGIFVYPALLRRAWGAPVMALLTVLLAVLFTAFDQWTRDGASLAASAVGGLVCALAPVLAGATVARLQRKGPPA